MKKYFIALITLVGMTVAANAQKTDITISYGGYTQMDATDTHDGWHSVNNAWGALNLGVNFNVARNLWIGPSYTFSSCSTKGGENHSNIAYHAIMMNGRYEYFRNHVVNLYGHVGIGAIISHMMPKWSDSYNCTYFAIQASPIGAEVDLNRDFTLFGEFGFGAQGLIQVGCRINL